MANNEKSFDELVKEAPLAPTAGCTSLVGTLSRSSEAGKFVLTLQDGNAVTLNTADVKAHMVLGATVGQTIVRIEIDSEKIPAINPQPLPPRANIAGTQFTLPSIDFATIAAADRIFTIPDIDHPFTTPAWRDFTYAWWDHHGTPPAIDYFPPGTGFADQIGPNTLAEGIPDPMGGFGGSAQTARLAPFAMATPHQALQGVRTSPYVDDPEYSGWRDKFPPNDFY